MGWDIIKSITNSNIETSIAENSELIEQLIDFIDIIHRVSLDELPKKRKIGNKNKGPKEIRTIKNRIKMLKRDKRSTKNTRKKQIVENKIYEAEEFLLKGIKKIDNEKEIKAIAAIKDNPKIFYSIYNRRKNRKRELGPIKENATLVYDGKEIGNIFKNIYISHFSRNNSSTTASPFEIEDINDLNDINFEIQDIVDAIDKLEVNSAPGPDAVPTIFLKNTKEVIAPHLTNLLRRSLDEGKIPEIFKMAYISPIHKGGSKQDPERYRPVSLTSHIAKVFERVIKKKIEKYLVDNAKLNNGQHGSVQGRRTQTELLAHYNDIYDALSEGKTTDTVYLDFAKAFDKVDHKILLEKVKKHGIGGKIGRWIEEFLKDRKFRVVVNGCMSDEAEVLSRVPQGTVLAALPH